MNKPHWYFKCWWGLFLGGYPMKSSRRGVLSVKKGTSKKMLVPIKSNTSKD